MIQTYKFEALNRESLKRWVSVLEKEIKACCHLDHVMLSPMPRLPTLITPQDFLSVAQTGDLLLFQSKSLGSNLQRIITRSNFDHVALLIKFPDGRLVIFEALRENGVTICDWDRFMTKKWHELYHRIVYRKLYSKRENHFNEVLEDFVR